MSDRRRVLTTEQLEAKRERDRTRRANFTDEQKEAERKRHRRYRGTGEAREARRDRDRGRYANMTQEQRAAKAASNKRSKARRRRELAEVVPLAVGQSSCAYAPCLQPAGEGDLCERFHSSPWGGAKYRNEWLIVNDGVYDETAVEAAAHGYRLVRLTWVERLAAVRLFLARYSDQPNLRALLAARLGTCEQVAERLIRRVREEDRSVTDAKSITTTLHITDGRTGITTMVSETRSGRSPFDGEAA